MALHCQSFTYIRHRNAKQSPFPVGTCVAKIFCKIRFFAHANGQWVKKIRGRHHCFGTWDDPLGARDRYLDQPAVDLIMGHAAATTNQITGEIPSRMAANYRQRLEDERLARVAAHVRAWLFPWA